MVTSVGVHVEEVGGDGGDRRTSRPGHPARAEVGVVLAAGLSSGAFGITHRAVLINLVARMQPASLPAVAEAIGQIDASQPSIGLAFALADLARLRHQMLTELEPA
jgi:hypothetical protein